jgi:leader peptidase (prepilin peptidase) / N-methyltransferase
MSVELVLSHGWLPLVFAVWVALSVGSFLNVAIYRLPVMLKRDWRDQANEILELNTPTEAEPAFNLMTPRSRCPRCRTPIAAWHNIPVFSWLMLRGRCAHCDAPISARYPLVELFTAVASILVLATFGYTWLGAAAVAFTWFVIVLTFIDLDTKLLPDSLTLPLLWLGLLVNVAGGFTDLASAVIGAVAGYLVLWSIYWAFKLITGKEGMGYGDFKLLAAFGAWFGWQTLPVLVLISSVVGVALGGAWLLARRSREPIPFGPFLAIAGWVTLLEHDRVIAFVFG